MQINDRLRWASVFGISTIFSAITMWTIFRTLQDAHPESWLQLYFNFAVWSAVLALFLLTFGWSMYGYADLGRKHNRPRLTAIALSYLAVLSAVYIVTEIDTFQYIHHVDPFSSTFGNALRKLIFSLYMGIPIVVSMAAYNITPRLQPATRLIAAVGIGWLLYVAYLALAIAFRIDAPNFLGAFLWMPIPEVLFAMASSVLFWRAADEAA